MNEIIDINIFKNNLTSKEKFFTDIFNCSFNFEITTNLPSAGNYLKMEKLNFENEKEG